MTKPKTQGERIARLEAHDEIDHKRIEKIETQVQEIHDLIMQGKGFKAALALFAAALGGLIGAAGAYISKGKFW